METVSPNPVTLGGNEIEFLVISHCQLVDTLLRFIVQT